MNCAETDSILNQSLHRLRNELHSLLNRLSMELGDKKMALAFWINNIFHVQFALNESNSPVYESEKLYFQDLMELKTGEFVNLILAPHLGKMIDFIDRCSGVDESLLDKNAMVPIASEFNMNWKKGLLDINGSTMQLFASFQNGARVLHGILTQFVVWYKRFLSIWALAFRNEKSTIVPIGIQTVLVEVKKYRSSFQ